MLLLFPHGDVSKMKKFSSVTGVGGQFLVVENDSGHKILKPQAEFVDKWYLNIRNLSA